MLNVRLTREARPTALDGNSEKGKRGETYSGSGCSTGGSWGGRFWSGHPSQSSCHPTVPYTPHTEEVNPNRESIVSKDSSTSCSSSGMCVNKLVKWVKPHDQYPIWYCLIQSNSCALGWFGLMWVKNPENNATDLKAVNVEVETEGLYDHCCPLPQRMPTTGTQLFTTDRPTGKNCEKYIFQLVEGASFLANVHNGEQFYFKTEN